MDYDKWVPVRSQEMEAFIGFSFLWGINPKPSVEDYWKKNPVVSYPPINQKITKDRYRDINMYLHFVDNSSMAPRGSVNYDKLRKIRPVLNYLVMRFKDLYKDNLLSKYMPMKPIKR